jgi:hypothetical protein
MENKMIYNGNFNNKKDVESNFSVSLDDVHIVYAEYVTGSYEGSAWVIFSRNGKLFEVHGSHCSCNGLEGQWSEEDTSADIILERIKRNGHSEFDTKSISQLLNQYKQDFSFDLENLPTANELKKLLSVEKLVQDKNILQKQDEQIKKFQQNIITQIKETLLNGELGFDFKDKLILSSEAISLKKYKGDVLKNNVLDLFSLTQETLNSKGYVGKFIINDSINEISCSFSFELTDKKIAKKRQKYVT